MKPILVISTQLIDKRVFDRRLLFWFAGSAVICLLLGLSLRQPAFLLVFFVTVVGPAFYARPFRNGLLSQMELNFYPDTICLNQECVHYKDLTKVKARPGGYGRYVYLRLFLKDEPERFYVLMDGTNIARAFDGQVMNYNASSGAEKVGFSYL